MTASISRPRRTGLPLPRRAGASPRPGHRPLPQGNRMPDPCQRRRVQLCRQPVRLLPPEDRHRHCHGGLSHRRSDRRAGAGDGCAPVLQAVSSTTVSMVPTWRRSTATAALACAPRSFSTTAPTKPPPSSSRVTSTGTRSSQAACAGSTAAASLPRSPKPPAKLIIEGMQAAKAAGAVISFDLNYRAKLWNIWGGPEKAAATSRPHRRKCGCAGRQ